MVSAKRRVGSLPHEVCRKEVCSRNRKKFQVQGLRTRGLSVWPLCIVSFTSKENKGSRFKKGRKDKRNSSGKGFIGETIFFQINTNW